MTRRPWSQLFRRGLPIAIGIACVVLVSRMQVTELPAEAASSVSVSAPMSTAYAMPAGWTQPLLARVQSKLTTAAFVVLMVVDGQGVSQFDQVRSVTLNAGQATDTRADWTIPRTQPAGTYTLQLRVFGATGETLATNLKAFQFQTAPPIDSGSPSPSKPPQPTPVRNQPCPAWVHDRYTATGPDGKAYPTWHPPIDPIYGCVFGHEHGDDPTGSPALNGRPVLFGYAATQMGMVEPHAGYKVFRQDNIHDAHAPNHDGASVLMTLHQGTSGAARFTQVYHDVSVHYVNPHDGREVHIDMLAPFGTLAVGCGANDPDMLLEVEQAPVPGMRQITADKCFNSPNIPYEDWITALYVGKSDSGSWKAYIDPHFAVNGPNTYCIVQNGACTLGYSDARAGTGADPSSTAAAYKGTRRDTYLNQVWLDNAGGSSVVWTDAHGMLTSAGAVGAIAQYVASVRQMPLGNSIAFGVSRDHGDPSTHAPN